MLVAEVKTWEGIKSPELKQAWEKIPRGQWYQFFSE
jgi:hypothetical protein